jgi:hypothetical protein
MIHLEERAAAVTYKRNVSKLSDGDDSPRLIDRNFTVLSNLVDYVPSSTGGAKCLTQCYSSP